MKQLVFTIIGFVSITGGANAFKPADRNALKSAIDLCIDRFDSTGDCCTNGDSYYKANGQPCPTGTTHLSDWDTSLVTDFSDLFSSLGSFNQDLRMWDTSSVTTMMNTFMSAFSFTNKDQPLWWDTSKVTNFYRIFAESKFNQCLCNWDTSSVTNMGMMFNRNFQFNQDLSCWDMSNVNSISYMFDTATGMDQTLNWNINSISSKMNWNKNANINIDTSHNPAPCVASISCNGVTCEENKNLNPDAVITPGSDPSSACCVAKTRGCKNADAVNYDASAGIDDSTQCILSCGENGVAQDGRCVCNSGYGGVKCHRQTSLAAKRKFVKDLRKNALPTTADLKRRQKSIKELAADLLQEKLLSANSIKEAVKESRIEVEAQDFSVKTQRMIQGLGKPMIAAAPRNHFEDDTCHLGASSDNCVTFDLADDTDTTTIVTVGDDIGSWSVLAEGDTILSKQTRTGEFTYDMQCWDANAENWGEVTAVDVTLESSKYACNGKVLLVASQAAVCTNQCGDNGVCSDDGEFYVCTCNPGWMGDHCELQDTRSHCFETNCNNYGGYKAGAGECDSANNECNEASCCVYATQTEFNTACDGHLTADDYLSARCCERTSC